MVREKTSFRSRNFILRHFEKKLSIVEIIPYTTDLRATCCNDYPYLCKMEKNRFSENLSGRRLLLTCFKTVTSSLFGFLFSSPDRLLYFARERAKLGPEIALFAKAGKPKYCAWLEKLTHVIKI